MDSQFPWFNTMNNLTNFIAIQIYQKYYSQKKLIFTKVFFKCKGDVAIAGILGEPSTGKTTLFNSIIGKKYAFEEDPKIKGLFLWSEPIYNQETNTYIFLMGKDLIYFICIQIVKG